MTMVHHVVICARCTWILWFTLGYFQILSTTIAFAPSRASFISSSLVRRSHVGVVSGPPRHQSLDSEIFHHRHSLLSCSHQSRRHSKTELHAFLSSSSSESWKEKWLEKLPASSVVTAIERQQKQPSGKVPTSWTASDVASAAGISLSQANRELTALASLTQGDIAVTSGGDLIYTFPENIRQVLNQNSAKYKALQTWETSIWPRLFWLIRVSFGATLLVSLVAIFSTIVFAQTYSSSSSSDDNRDNGRERGGGGIRLGGGWNYFWGPSPFDFFYYRPYYGSYYSQQQQQAPRDPEDMGFLESIFSYVFGDGNPNAGLEEKRLRLAAQMIRDNKGVVTAEQLAPFCDDVPTPAMSQESTIVDESFVLPIVSQLNGEPQVTEDGNIVYLFPELQQSTSTAMFASATSTSSMLVARQKKESKLLRRAGLRPDASAYDIQQLLRFNGISTRGALEKSDLIDRLEQVLPKEADDDDDDGDDTEDPSMLTEREYKFSLASDLNKFLAGGLGILNLGGALYVGTRFVPNLASAALSAYRLPGWVGIFLAAFPWLLTYAVLYNAIPLFRSFYVKQQNEKIQQRNQVRRLWKAVLNDSSNRELQAKVKAAQAARRRLLQQQTQDQLGASTAKEIIFDTSQPMEDRDKMRQLEALKEFDNLLGRSSSQPTENDEANS